MLYKYTSHKYLKTIIENSSIWFSNLESLNDPFECNLSNHYYSYVKYEKEKSKYFRDRTSSRFPSRRPGPLNHYYDYPLEGRQERYVSRDVSKRAAHYWTLQNRRNEAYILSLSQTYDNPVLWAHYAENHSGVCIGVDENEIETTLADLNLEWRKISVKYLATTIASSGSYGDIDETFWSSISVKHPKWKYEEEIRYVVTKKSEEKGFPVFFARAIKEIILGIKSTVDFKIAEYIRDCTFKLSLSEDRSWFDRVKFDKE